MGRYKIALLRNQKSEKKAFHFSKTGSVIKVTQYINYCQSHNGIFIADNISEDILDSAVVSVSNHHKIPLVLESESAARALSISHSYKRVYSYKNVPVDIYVNNGDDIDRFVICYNCHEDKLPAALKALVIIYGREKFEELLSL